MSVTVVITQPMFFPWVGLLEQVKLADVVVFYDDVQYARGFFNRVQIKTAAGTPWMTVPLADLHRGQLINQVRIDDSRAWRTEHIDALTEAYRRAPHFAVMLELVRSVYDQPCQTLDQLSIASTLALCEHFGLRPARGFVRSSQLGVPGRAWERLLAITRHLGGDVYVSGHGGKNYIDHPAMAAQGVDVRYMEYAKQPYPQLHGPFTPFVSALDLVASEGAAGALRIGSPAVSWRELGIQA